MVHEEDIQLSLKVVFGKTSLIPLQTDPGGQRDDVYRWRLLWCPAEFSVCVSSRWVAPSPSSHSRVPTFPTMTVALAVSGNRSYLQMGHSTPTENPAGEGVRRRWRLRWVRQGLAGRARKRARERERSKRTSSYVQPSRAEQASRCKNVTAKSSAAAQEPPRWQLKIGHRDLAPWTS